MLSVTRVVQNQTSFNRLIMKIHILNNSKELGIAAGSLAASLIKNAIKENGYANIILATGTSQFETLHILVTDKEIAWDKVTMFHLDEYIALPVSSKASFRNYLQERFSDRVPQLKSINLINGEVDPKLECQRLNQLITEHPIDVALIGIGENGHLAFNDPPADFDTTEPFIIVQLDEACRKQQLGEGWFSSLAEVPTHAISMSVKQIMKSQNIVCSVPDSRKALAVKNSLVNKVSNRHPASILQLHENCMLFLDPDSASLLSGKEKILYDHKQSSE